MKHLRGFTLIEMLVSTAIFTVVMVIALGALLAMSESDRKAQTLKSVINNLNFSLDAISRTVRTGYNYQTSGCSAGTDCTTPPGSTAFSFTEGDGTLVSYRLENTTIDPGPTGAIQVCGQSTGAGCLARSVNGGAWAAITAPEVVITNLSFYLLGSAGGPADTFQPKLTILMSGYVQFKGGAGAAACASGVSTGSATCFNLETSVTQRIYDQ